ncbi:MAG TPA: ABC transporter permease [bacterium]|nr:ABC transporter permease [bacterium]
MLVGGAIVLLVVLTAVFAGTLSPHDPEAQSLVARLLPPGSPSYPLGTDALGRDLLSQILFGSRISLDIAVRAVVLSMLIGTALGLASGYYGGVIDSILMRLADAQLAIPYLVLAIAIVATFGAGVVHLLIVMVLGGWVYYARVIRSSTLAMRSMEFVQAATAVGASDARTVVRHILPNLLSSVIVISTLQLGQMILIAATLSFLGLGLPANVPSWGGMAADGEDYLATAWWIATLPGMAIFITTIGSNYLGDGIREALDPKLRI